MPFQSVQQDNEQKSFDIFEALDLGESGLDYFKDRCEAIPKATLLGMRDQRSGNEGRTLLHNAARLGLLPAVLYLLNIGHTVEPIDNSLSKKTPLMDAIQTKSVDVVVVLVESGAKLDTYDISNDNAYHYAARAGCARIIRWMTKAAKLTQSEIQEIASFTNIKAQLPWHLAVNTICRDILVNFQAIGSSEYLFKGKKGVFSRINTSQTNRTNSPKAITMM